jgi:hypothetical protein
MYRSSLAVPTKLKKLTNILLHGQQIGAFVIVVLFPVALAAAWAIWSK